MNTQIPDQLPCTGKHELFDSIEQADHVKARAMCATCPALDWCRDHASRVFTDSTHPSAGAFMVGTWAGGLFGRQNAQPGAVGRRPRVRNPHREVPILPDEAKWGEEEARLAANAYRRGDRSDWAREGRRIYNRRNMRKQCAEMQDDVA